MLRRYFRKRNEHKIPTTTKFLKSLKHKDKITALSFEIKGLNNINIRFGYDITNGIISRTISKVSRLIEDYGILYRTDRNVYLVNFINDTSTEAVKKVHKILLEFFKKVYIDLYSLSFEISTGAIVDFEYDKNDKHKIISTLSLAVGKSNADTSHPLVFLNEKSYDNNLRMLKKLEAVKNSVTRGCEDFYLVYQPFVSGISSKIIGAEALLRWENEEFGSLPPGVFIPYIENFACSYELGMWIIRKALEDVKEIIDERPEFFININLSYTQLKNKFFKYEVIKILEELNFPPQNLQFELTERCKQLDIKLLKEEMAFLKKYGIKIALDDFGTGTSTLKLMGELPVDSVKIDQSFILNIISNPSNEVIVETVLDCAKRLGTSVCLEGVENLEIKDYVSKYFANYHQGYYYSKPVKLDVFKNIIDKTWESKSINLIKSTNKASFDVYNIISMMPGGFFSYVNDESERIILANEALLDIFECSNMDEFKDLTSNSFKGLVHKDDYERVENEINNQILNSSKKYDRVKYRIVTKTGKVKTVIDYGHLVEKEFNDDIFYVFIVEEI